MNHIFVLCIWGCFLFLSFIYPFNIVLFLLQNSALLNIVLDAGGLCIYTYDIYIYKVNFSPHVVVSFFLVCVCGEIRFTKHSLTLI